MPKSDLKQFTEKVKLAAAGRWAEILPAATGIPTGQLETDGGPCPIGCSPPGNDRFSMLPTYADDGAVHCRKCFHEGSNDGFAVIQKVNGCTFPDAVKVVADVLGIAAPTKSTKRATPTVDFSAVPLDSMPKPKQPVESRLNATATEIADNTHAFSYPPPVKNGGTVHATAKKALDAMLWSLTSAQNGKPPTLAEKRNPDHVYLYFYPNRKFAFLYCRWDFTEAEQAANNEQTKTFRCLRVTKDGWQWSIKGVENRPLYGLHNFNDQLRRSIWEDTPTESPEVKDVSDAETVYVCEGEKAANALRQIGLTAVSPCQGAQSPDLTDWSPLAGKRVIILPDSDLAGERFAAAVAGLVDAQAAGATVEICHLSDDPDFADSIQEKDDAADWSEYYDSKPAEWLVERLESLPDRKSEYNIVIDSDSGKQQSVANNLPDGLDSFDIDKGDYSDLDAISEAELFLHRKYGADDGGHHSLAYHHGQFLRFRERRYERFGKDDLRCDVVRHLRGRFKKVTTTSINEAIDIIKSDVHVDPSYRIPCHLDDPTKQFIGFRNGLIGIDDIVAGQPVLRPHTHSWLSTSILPYDFEPDATCHKWREALFKTFRGDLSLISIVQEWFGYNLTLSTKYQKFVLMVGSGSNGKSAVQMCLQSMIGDGNYTAVGLSDFGDKFAPTAMLDKRANIVGEFDIVGSGKVAEGNLKSLVSGDVMEFYRKYKSSITATPTAKLTFGTNKLPPFRDKSDGLWRRIILIPFDHKIQSPVPAMATPDYWVHQGEMPGILNWAIQGLVRLTSQGRFTQSDASDAALEKLRNTCDPARQFLTEHFEWTGSPDNQQPRLEIYNEYREWCSGQGVDLPVKQPTFNGIIRTTFPQIRDSKTGSGPNREWHWLGLVKKSDSVIDHGWD